MTGASNFVLQWKIDNARTALAKEQAASEEFHEGGFIWKTSTKKNVSNVADYILECRVDHDYPWYCKGEVEIDVIDVNGSAKTGNPMSQFCFTDTHIAMWFENCNYWPYLIDPKRYCVNGTVTINFRLKIISSSGCCGSMLPTLDPPDIAKFISPVETSNVTLLIGDKNLVVSKEFLALHSPVFTTMFFGNFMEKNKKEVKIKDVEYEEFVSLLQVVFPDGVDVSDANVLHVTKLADRFQIKRILNWAENHLLSPSSKFGTTLKLEIADSYRFTKLRDNCLQSYKSVQELKIYQNSSTYANFSDQTKAAISDRMIELL